MQAIGPAARAARLLPDDEKAAFIGKLRRFLAKLEEKTHTTSSYWDNALIGAVRTPATWLAWIVGLSFAVEILQIETKVTLLHVVEPVRIIGVVGCLTWFVIRFIGNVQHGVIARRQANNEPVDITTVDAIGKLLRVSVLLAAWEADINYH